MHSWPRPDPPHIRYLLALISLSYGVSSLPAGYLCDRWGPGLMTPLSSFFCAFAIPLMALPMAINAPVWPDLVCWQAATCALFGAAQSAMAVCLFPLLMHLVQTVEPEHASVVSSLVTNGLFAVGLTIGPPLSGLLMQFFGFVWAMVGLSGMLFTVTVVTTVHRRLSSKE